MIRSLSTSTAAHKLHVGIIGLGTAGLASAIFLQQQGHDVTIYETTTSENLDTVAGAGIGMQPIGLTVLHRLGLLESVLNKGARIDQLHAITREGRDVLDLRYSDFRPELFGLGLHRDVLFTTLYNEAVRCGGSDGSSVVGKLEIVTGFTAGSIIPNAADTGSDILEHVDEGDSINLQRKEGSFDLVVVCDGRNSIRKNMKHVQSIERKYPFGCLWTILPDHEREFTSRNELYQRLDSSRTMLGFLPTGQGPNMTKEDPELVSIFWSLDMSTVDTVMERGLDAWKEQVVALEPRSEQLFEGLTSMDQLIPAAYSDTYMPRLYDSSTRTVFLGDAAHATSPQLGQGANLALVDAWVLSEVVASAWSHSNGGGGSGVRDALVQRAMVEFDRERRWRLRFYQLNSKLLTPVFQSNSKVIGSLRDIFMGPLCRFPVTRLQMLTVLCGAQNNGIPWTTIPEEEYMGYVR